MKYLFCIDPFAGDCNGPCRLVFLRPQYRWGQTSPLLSDLFCLRSVSTTHRTARLTRSQVSNGLVLPNVSRRFGLHSLSYLAAVKWNSAPPDIRNATSLHALRIQLSTWLGHPVRRPIGL